MSATASKPDGTAAQPFRLVTLKSKAEFARVRGGGRTRMPAFTLEGKARQAPVANCNAAPSPALTGGSLGARFGFIITKKIGNAVTRNRIRRRLRAALTEIAPCAADARFDYVLVAYQDVATQPFTDLLASLTQAFDKVHASANRSPRAAKTKPPP